MWTKFIIELVLLSFFNLSFLVFKSFKIGYNQKRLFQEGECQMSDSFCDFESDDKCGYTLDETADFLWIWKQGSTPTGQTGPAIGDHSTGTEYGHYMVTGIL